MCFEVLKHAARGGVGGVGGDLKALQSRKCRQAYMGICEAVKDGPLQENHQR